MSGIGSERREKSNPLQNLPSLWTAIMASCNAGRKLRFHQLNHGATAPCFSYANSQSVAISYASHLTMILLRRSRASILFVYTPALRLAIYKLLVGEYPEPPPGVPADENGCIAPRFVSGCSSPKGKGRRSKSRARPWDIRPKPFKNFNQEKR